MSSRHETFDLVVLRPLRWRDGADGLVELHDPARDAWARMQPWTRPVIEAIERGVPLGAILAQQEGRDAAIGRLVLSLAKVGYARLDVPLPALPGYEVERVLGVGGVGIAFLAREGDARVVLKRAWGFVHPLPLAQAALAREAEVLRVARSPHIVPFRSWLAHDGREWLVRGFAPGASLTEGEPGPARALRVLDGLGGALDALHAAGHALADHKPGNLFDDGARVLVADVGHARPLAASARAAGTPGFSAPEKIASVAGDVHGLGRMVAFARTGRMFRRDPPLDEVLDGIEPPLRDALSSVCSPDPGARPALADARAQLRDALR